MDKSETYIKMCKEAEEIQSNWIPRAGDNVTDNIYRSLLVIMDLNCSGRQLVHVAHTKSNMYDNTDYMKQNNLLWLPRQDQLQEMSKCKNETPAFRASLLVDWCNEGAGYMCGADEYSSNFTTFEQLWLAFVMHEKYNKKWNGETWINQ